MKVLKTLVIVILLLLVAAVAVAYLLPNQFKVERSTTINASPDTIYSYVSDLKNWKQWGVWYERDPNMTVTYTDDTSGIGATSYWQSETEGNGEMEILQTRENELVHYALRFPDMGMESTGRIEIRSEGDASHVTWSQQGELGNNPLYRWFGLMMDSMVGADFEQGLENLKKQAEQGPPAAAE